VFVSALGADASSPVPFLRAKAETEACLVRSQLPYTIIAPNVFMEVWIPLIVGAAARARQPVTLVGEGRRRHSFVSVRDVAAFAAAAVGRAEATNAYLAVGGPVPLSWRDIVATYERALGREIPVRFVAPGDPGIGLPDPLPALLASLETFESPIEMTELARTFDVRLTPVDVIVREDLAASPAP
jgi:NADH dehydrogenase